MVKRWIGAAILLVATVATPAHVAYASGGINPGGLPFEIKVPSTGSSQGPAGPPQTPTYCPVTVTPPAYRCPAPPCGGAPGADGRFELWLYPSFSQTGIAGQWWGTVANPYEANVAWGGITLPDPTVQPDAFHTYVAHYYPKAYSGLQGWIGTDPTTLEGSGTPGTPSAAWWAANKGHLIQGDPNSCYGIDEGGAFVPCGKLPPGIKVIDCGGLWPVFCCDELLAPLPCPAAGNPVGGACAIPPQPATLDIYAVKHKSQGTIATAPATNAATYTDVPTCAWLQNDQIPDPFPIFFAGPVAKVVRGVPASKGLEIVWVYYVVTTTGSAITWDWGDGFKDPNGADVGRGKDPGGAFPTYNSQAATWNLNGCAGGVYHHYQTTSNSRTITAHQTYHINVTAWWSVGSNPPSSQVLQDIDVPLTWTLNKRVYQIQGVPVAIPNHF